MNDIDYQGKCDKCGQTRPKLTVPVLKDKDGEKHRIQLAHQLSEENFIRKDNLHVHLTPINHVES
jgi:hypothetical protein